MGDMWNIDDDFETLEVAAQKRKWALEQLDKRTANLAIHVRDEFEKGESIMRLAKRAGVSRPTIYDWIRD